MNDLDRLLHEYDHARLGALTRRHFLRTCTTGLGAMWFATTAGKAADTTARTAPASSGVSVRINTTQNDNEPPGRAARNEEPAATYSPRPVKAKYHRRCGA